MKTPRHTLEGLLDSGFDISEDDIQPLKNFAKEHRSKGWNNAMSGTNISGKFLEIILRSYGEMIGGVNEIDWNTIFKDIAKSGDSLMVWRPNINNVEIYTCEKPQARVRWSLHTQNPRRLRSSWTGSGYQYSDGDIRTMPWANPQSQAGKEAKLIRLQGRRALDEIIAGLSEASK